MLWHYYGAHYGEFTFFMTVHDVTRAVKYFTVYFVKIGLAQIFVVKSERGSLVHG